MSDDICLLITFLWEPAGGPSLYQCALKIKRAQLPGGAAECPREPENEKYFLAALPDHITRGGRIVDVVRISEIVDATPRTL